MPKHQTTGKHRESDGELPQCNDGHCTVSKTVTFRNDIMPFRLLIVIVLCHFNKGHDRRNLFDSICFHRPL